ncbi:exopolyphosphatase [Pedobacter sp. Leaf176]|uniref:Ppx/GppA phosphatase family protein n=1 Tax=Pedobacter sp. Leaf176 TaxID=1736286 RepID=UPI0006F85B94|nr:exopolyphosphatase [Pedobacter sp. Leaf176]KQR70507.1 exopolyphosphatase [Pedobacter sp. Leaf176]
MRLAVIDLGTNTFHLLIVESKDKEFEILYKTTIPVRLGEGRINDNVIIPAAFERGISTLRDFRKKLEEYKVDKVKATATSAIRSAENGKDFVRSVKEQVNIDIEIITGDEEAASIYKGVKLSGAIEDLTLIMDIGGGSIEFILCDTEKFIWKKSYNIGAARLMQKFFKSDPISDDDKSAITNHIQNQLNDLFQVCGAYQPQTLIGSAGAFETFAELIIRKNNETVNVAEIKVYEFNYNDYIATAQALINATHHERAMMPGMIQLRIDMIVMAVLITNYVMERLKITTLKLSTYDLKMGVLADLL